MKALGIILVVAALLTPQHARAHRAWLLPSATVLSGEEVWITVDAASANDLFYFDHRPIPLDGLVVLGPDGNKIEPQNPHTGRFRSSFDVALKSPGTYRLAVVSHSLFASYEKDGETVRWRGKPEDLAKEVPADAKNLTVSQSQRRIETFATLGAPNDTALKAVGSGLELVPITHPNNLFAGEEARFKLQLDGKPAPNVEVTVIRDGIRYRDKLGELTSKTDDHGEFAVTWPEPGMYWVEASVTDSNVTVSAAKERRLGYAATLEVLPQ